MLPTLVKNNILHAFHTEKGNIHSVHKYMTNNQESLSTTQNITTNV